MGYASSMIAYQTGGIQGARATAGAESGMNFGLSIAEQMTPQGRIAKTFKGMRRVFGNQSQKEESVMGSGENKLNGGGREQF